MEDPVDIISSESLLVRDMFKSKLTRGKPVHAECILPTDSYSVHSVVVFTTGR